LEGGHLLRARNDSLKTGDKVEKVGLEKEGDEGRRGREGERGRGSTTFNHALFAL
jgi:hypothetical protein